MKKKTTITIKTKEDIIKIVKLLNERSDYYNKISPYPKKWN